MKLSKPLLLVIVVAFPSSRAGELPLRADESPVWTAAGAVAEMSELLARSTKTRDAIAERQKAIAAWTTRVEATRLDLGRHGYLLAIGKYMQRDFTASTRQLVEYFSSYQEIPDTAHARDVGRAAMSATNQALRSKDYATAELLADAAVRYFPDALTVYRVVASQLVRDRGDEARAVLNRVLHAALGDERLDDKQKQDLLARLYSSGSLPGTATGRTTRATPSTTRRGTPTRAKFVEFSDVDTDGKQVSIADYRGKVLLVDYWATWCAPCIREMPNVVAAYKQYHDRGFEVIGVSLDGANAEGRIESITTRLGMSWRQIYDGKGWRSRVAQLNSIRSIPSTFLLDRSGKVRYTNLRGRALAAKVDQLVREPAPSAK